MGSTETKSTSSDLAPADIDLRVLVRGLNLDLQTKERIEQAIQEVVMNELSNINPKATYEAAKPDAATRFFLSGRTLGVIIIPKKKTDSTVEK